MTRTHGGEAKENRNRRRVAVAAGAPALLLAAAILAAGCTQSGTGHSAPPAKPTKTTKPAPTTPPPATTPPTTPATTPPTTPPTVPPTKPTTPVPTAVTVALKSGVVTYSHSGKVPYTVSCEYPVLSGTMSTSAADSINTAIYTKVSSAVSSFEGYENGTKSLPPYTFPGSLTCSWTQAWLSPTLGSLSFIASDFPNGAAHPFAGMTTFNFNPTTGELYTLGDLFTSGSDWLNVLSQQSRTLLPAQLGPFASSFLELKPGTAPTASNFAAFELTTAGLAITFQEYQVGPYAAGMPEVHIPYGALGSIANPSGPLANPPTHSGI